MEASARTRRVVAVAESPAQKTADPNTRGYAKARLRDIGGAVAEQADALEEKLQQAESSGTFSVDRIRFGSKAHEPDSVRFQAV